MSNFISTFSYKLIYIFRINDNEHSSCLKIGETTIHTDKDYTNLADNCKVLNEAARKRIDQYTSTAGIAYDLLHTEVAVYKDKNGYIRAFSDKNVHSVLLRSGFKNKYFDTNLKQNEWFIVNLQTAINAIKAVKANNSSLHGGNISNKRDPIIFRPEQKEAIKKTINVFKKHNEMLWNAKMRFGKTLSALQVVKELKFKRTIIVTHRPVVSESWYEDFDKIFYDEPHYLFGSKNKGETLEKLLNSPKSFVYFASIQDLRGSTAVGGSFDKNIEIFDLNWDFVVVDEAHEGTQTKLGENVLSKLVKNDNEHTTYVLKLSGTPFNLINKFEPNYIYTWDYIMEQEAKEMWPTTHFLDSNPYEELPRLNIFTYHLEKSLPNYLDIADKAFNFRLFFKVWTGDKLKDGCDMPSDVVLGDFMYKNDIKAFLDLICSLDDSTNYPYSTQEYRNYFRHTLWVLPGVKEAKAMSKMLKEHQVFRNFEIINVAGDGDEEVKGDHALSLVYNAIGDNPEETYTITLSCGRLTTGVSVKPWTAVLMLAGSYSTAASQYLQTIFRVQTPANINGKIKKECYVFDFAPDRTLKMVAESISLHSVGSEQQAKILATFLNYCPVIALTGSNMKKYTVEMLLQELKKAYAERVARNGFDDPKIYNDQLLKLTDLDIEQFNDLKKIVGDSKQTKKTREIDINKEGFDNIDVEIEVLEKNKKRELSEEEKEKLRQLKEQRDKRTTAISILRAISIRLPLLIYGMNIDINVDINIEDFTNLVDDASWEEFMPKGVTKDIFKSFTKYYDKDIFIGASRKIRITAKNADTLEPTERIKQIANLFSTFKNPDKETVLTPWRVVNMHLSDIIGGYDFFNDKHDILLDEPRFIEHDGVTLEIFNKNSNILEINSKTGLYPLYVTYSLYKEAIKDLDYLSLEDKYRIWDEIVENQLFVICKTNMAKCITKRTLLGYRDGITNMHAFDDLIMQLKDKQEKFIDKISKPNFWGKKGSDKMKFNAIVGNPPYQIMLDDNKMSMNVYHEFIKTSAKIDSKFVTLITPAKWMGGELGPYKEMKNFFNEFTKDKHIMKILDFPLSSDIFNGVDIKGGISYFLYSNDYQGPINYNLIENGMSYSQNILVQPGDNVILRFPQLVSITNKVSSTNPISFKSIVSSWNPYGFISDLFDKNKEGIKLYEEKIALDLVDILGLEKKKRTIKYINKKDMIKDSGGLNKYKVFVPRANGTGAFGEKFSTPMIGTPMMICTDTFLEVGPFDNEFVATSCLKYVKTKFLRSLVGAKKTGVFNYKDAFTFVPMLDFTENSDINWQLSIKEIDKQLYTKYNLSQDEIDFIETKVTPME